MNNKQNRSAAWVSRLVLGLGAGTVLLLPSPAMAQADPIADETIWGTSNDSPDLMDIIQRGQVGSTQSRAEFQRNQQVNLGKAAEAFQEAQRKQMEAMEMTEAKSPGEAKPTEAVKPAGNEAEEPVQSRTTGESPRPALW